jgi:alpha-N-arabinofuranosidase
MKEVPFVETIGILNEEKRELTVFAVNRSLEDSIDFEIDLRDFTGASVIEHIVLENEDLKAVNTSVTPDHVAPHKNGVTKRMETSAIATLNKCSWNVIRFSIK